MKTLLKNFDILFPSDYSVASGASILIEDGKILEIIRNGGQGRDLKPDRTVEGERRLLMPGFFNAHAHLGMTIFRGYKDDVVLEEWLQDWIWPAEEELTPEEVYWGSKLALVEAIRSGTTAVADMYFNMDQTARSIEETGIRGLISYGLIAEDMDKAGEKELKEALELADEWDGSADGRIKVALSPHAPYTCGKEVLKEVSRLSRERGLPIHTHISETRGEVEESYEKFGVSPVKRLQDLGLLENPVLAAHCVHVNEEDVKTLKENDVVVAHNPTSNMKIASGAAPIEKMRQAGVDLTLGTDGPGTNNDLDIFEEMRQASFLAKLESDDPTALSAEDTLKIATASETDVLGFPGSGRIEEGAPADLIGVRRNPTYWTPEYDTVSNLVYSGKSREVDLVIADGEIVMEDGEIKTVDEREVINRVREIAEKYEKIRENKK